jgi:hypothetical protein
MNTSIRKIVAMVNALAKLHNFCKDVEEDNTVLLDTSVEDLQHLMDGPEGYINLNQVEGIDTPVPLELMDGGRHFNDVPEAIRKRHMREQLSSALPRTQLLLKVINSNMDRPSTNRR